MSEVKVVKVWTIGPTGIKEYAKFDPATAKFKLGCVITHANGPILWDPKMQTQLSLSPADVEHIALTFTIQYIVPLIGLANELCDEFKCDIFVQTLIFFPCIDDSSGALEIAKLPKMCPQTKYINICYHH